MTTPTVPATGPVLVVMLMTTGGLLDEDRGTGGHWDGLRHPGLRLDVGLLRVRSAALIDKCVVGIIGAPDKWDSLYVAGVLLRIAGWMELGCVGIWRTASVVWRTASVVWRSTSVIWRSPTVVVGCLIDRDRYTGGTLVGRAIRRDYRRTRVERN